MQATSGFLDSNQSVSSSVLLLPDDFHQLTLHLCPDFLRALVHTVSWLQNGGKSTASTSPVNFAILLKGFVVYFHYLEFFLQVLIFFQTAYDGASGSKSPRSPSKAIVMPPLLCSVDESPIRELSLIYGSTYASPNKRGEKGDEQNGPSISTPPHSWRRAFGCSVDVSHISVALRRIERGCRDAGVPFIPASTWGKSTEREAGTKMTLERVWKMLTGDDGLWEELRGLIVSE